MTELVELTTARPVSRVAQLSTGYDSSGASATGEGDTVEARILPGRKGQTIRVEYTGVREAIVTFAKVGEVYDAVDMPEIPSCIG
ncbi:hypothetical protein KB221_07415 [Aquidulcibacter paucihalophilus]|nr:hypothetical protein KB221_07415 [Aquidulcibacter paucihalophilus]